MGALKEVIMEWLKVKGKYKETWLVVEADQAQSLNGKRLVSSVKVLADYKNSEDAYRKYQNIHKQDPKKEVYVVYSDWNELSFDELSWQGLRGRVFKGDKTANI